MFWVTPLLKVPVTVYWTVDPDPMLAVLGMTASESRVPVPC